MPKNCKHSRGLYSTVCAKCGAPWLDIYDFPDGGTAKVTRRHAPRLTRQKLACLREYQKGGSGHTIFLACARALQRDGLLAENVGGGKGRFQLTEAGAQVVALWKSAGF